MMNQTELCKTTNQVANEVSGWCLYKSRSLNFKAFQSEHWKCISTIIIHCCSTHAAIPNCWFILLTKTDQLSQKAPTNKIIWQLRMMVPLSLNRFLVGFCLLKGESLQSILSISACRYINTLIFDNVCNEVFTDNCMRYISYSFCECHKLSQCFRYAWAFFILFHFLHTFCRFFIVAVKIVIATCFRKIIAKILQFMHSH